MEILVTGSAGVIGRVVTAHLAAHGHKAVQFDLLHGQDIRQPSHIEQAMDGCTAVIHLAALMGDNGHIEADIFEVNEGGTRNLLAAATRAGIERMVYFSSMEVLGIFRGERLPQYLPLDDNHPCHPVSAYAVSKYLAEGACEEWSRQTGGTAICLRLPGVFSAETYNCIKDARRAEPRFEWEPFWQFGAFLDIRDAASAALRALNCPASGHHVVGLCADDISSSSLGSHALARQIMPGVPWHGGPEYAEQPFKALVRTDRAQALLGWQPRHRWR